jgi:hypothetical protein
MVKEIYFFKPPQQSISIGTELKKWIKVIEIIIMTLHRGYTETYIFHSPLNYNGIQK